MIFYRDGANVNPATGQTTVVFTKPALAKESDVILAVVNTSAAVTVTPPTGWSLVHSQTSTACCAYVYRRTVLSSEPTTYSFGLSASVTAGGSLNCFAGVDTAAPILAHGSTSGNGIVPNTVPVSVAAGNARFGLFSYFAIANAATWNTSSGKAARCQRTAARTTSVNLSLNVCDGVQAAGTSVTTASLTPSSTTGDSVCGVVVLLEDAAFVRDNFLTTTVSSVDNVNDSSVFVRNNTIYGIVDNGTTPVQAKFSFSGGVWSRTVGPYNTASITDQRLSVGEDISVYCQSATLYAIANTSSFPATIAYENYGNYTKDNRARPLVAQVKGDGVDYHVMQDSSSYELRAFINDISSITITNSITAGAYIAPIAYGDIHNDGISRIICHRTDTSTLVEYFWNGTAFVAGTAVSCAGMGLYGGITADIRDEGFPSLYCLNQDTTYLGETQLWEWRWFGGTYVKTRIASFPYKVHYLETGDPFNRGVDSLIIGADIDTQTYILELFLSGGIAKASVIGSPLDGALRDFHVGDTRGTGTDSIVVATATGIYEWYNQGATGSTPAAPTWTSPVNGTIVLTTTPFVFQVPTDADLDVLEFELQIASDAAFTQNLRTYRTADSRAGWQKSADNITYNAMTGAVPQGTGYLRFTPPTALGVGTWHVRCRALG